MLLTDSRRDQSLECLTEHTPGWCVEVAGPGLLRLNLRSGFVLMMCDYEENQWLSDCM